MNQPGEQETHRHPERVGENSDRTDVNGANRRLYRERLQYSLTSAEMYRVIARFERDRDRSDGLARLAEQKASDAILSAERLAIGLPEAKSVKHRVRFGLLGLAVWLLGSHRLIPLILRLDSWGQSRSEIAGDVHMASLMEHRYSLELLKLAGAKDELQAVRLERQHLTNQSGSLRAAVLGINDGLVSNVSLVMGVAGGVGNADIVLLAGVAGLLAGSFSMAAGEYVSMRSQRDVYENEIRLEKAKIEHMPDEERRELVLIYRAKGLSAKEAEAVASRVMQDPEVALETMSREELGLDPSGLGSPWAAALSSLVAFVVGASVPILPYLFGVGDLAFVLSGVLSGCALVLVGAMLGWLSNRPIIWSGVRMLLVGSGAAVVTFGVGRAIGVVIQL